MGHPVQANHGAGQRLWLREQDRQRRRRGLVVAATATAVLHDLRGHEQLGLRSRAAAAAEEEAAGAGADLPGPFVTPHDLELFGLAR